MGPSCHRCDTDGRSPRCMKLLSSAASRNCCASDRLDDCTMTNLVHLTCCIVLLALQRQHLAYPQPRALTCERKEHNPREFSKEIQTLCVSVGLYHMAATQAFMHSFILKLRYCEISTSASRWGQTADEVYRIKASLAKRKSGHLA